jgi:ABC-type branched-subunit amino acid transport system substrate-binding protein
MPATKLLAMGNRRMGVVAIAVLAVTLAACSSGASSADASSSTAKGGGKSPYNVQIVSDLTGSFASLGGPGASGFEVAFQKVNAAGGVNGHPIQYTVSDAQSSTTGAQAVGRSAVSASPVAIGMATASVGLNALIPIFQAAAIPVVSDTNIDSIGAANPPTSWFYSDAATAFQLSTYMVDGTKAALGGSLKGKSIAIEGLQSPSVDPEIASIESLVKGAGGSVSSIQRQPPGATSFASGAANIVAGHPNAVEVIDTTGGTILVAQALETAGFKGPMVTTEGASDDVTLQKINLPNFYGARVTNIAVPGTVPYQAAVKYGKTADAANPYFEKGWAGAYIIVNALTKCGFPCSPQQFKKAAQGLGKFTVPGDAIFGPYWLSASRHTALTTAQLFVWDSAKNKSVPSGKPIDITKLTP